MHDFHHILVRGWGHLDLCRWSCSSVKAGGSRGKKRGEGGGWSKCLKCFSQKSRKKTTTIFAVPYHCEMKI